MSQVITKTAVPLRAMRPVAERLVETLAPFCERIEIAGSIRRQKRFVGDIELVVIPRTVKLEQQTILDLVPSKPVRVNLLDEQLGRMQRTRTRPIFRSRLACLKMAGRRPEGGDLQRWGEKYKRFYLWGDDRYGVIPIDLFITEPKQWGAMLCIRTGPNTFNQAMMRQFIQHTPYRQRDGLLVCEATGAVVPIYEESDYFERAGMNWIPPERRTVDALELAIRDYVPPMTRVEQAVYSVDADGIVYTTDEDVRAQIRARLERSIGLGETDKPGQTDPASPGAA